MLQAILPQNVRPKVKLVLAVIGVAASVAAIFYADRPEVALAIQALTALGVLGPNGRLTEEYNDLDFDFEGDV